MSLTYHQSASARRESLGLAALTRGALLTAGTANVKGSWATVGTAGFTYEHLVVQLGKNNTAADYVVDIGIEDGATNRWVIAADLRLPGRVAVDEAAIAISLPLHVPSGALLRARCASSTGSATCDVILQGASSGVGGAPGFSRCIALYAPALSRGVLVDPGGTINTKVRTQIIASSSAPVGAVFAIVGREAVTTRTGASGVSFDIEFGAAASETVVVANHRVQFSTAFDTPSPYCTPIWACGAPSASRFSVNAQSGTANATDRLLDVALYGLVS